jgi:hypothetical protein
MKSFSDRGVVLRRRRAPLPLMLTAAVWLFMPGCASLGNTPEQEVAWSRWEACQSRVGGTELNTVQVDGRISFWYGTGGDRQGALDCLRQVAKGGPVLPEPLAQPFPGGSGGGAGGM